MSADTILTAHNLVASAVAFYGRALTEERAASSSQS